MKHQPKSDPKSDFPGFSYGYEKCMFVDSQSEYMETPSYVH